MNEKPIKQGDWIVYMNTHDERREAQVIGWDTRLGCQGFLIRTNHSPFQSTVPYDRVIGRSKS